MRTLLICLTILCLGWSALGADLGSQKRVNGLEVTEAVNGASSNQELRGFRVSSPAGTTYQTWWVTDTSHILISNAFSGKLMWDIDQDNDDVFYNYEFFPKAANLTIGRNANPWLGGYFSSLVQFGTSDGAHIATNNSTVTNLNIRPANQAAGSGITIGPGSNVGIGTNAPASLLHVQGGTIQFQQISTRTRVGGTYHVAPTPIFNAGVAATNIFTNYIPAHTLTNAGDTVRIELAGQMMNAAATTNRFQLTYGSEMVLDTGIVSLFSNTVYRIYGAITRSGNTTEIVDIGIQFAGLPVGAPYAFTNSVRLALQTNGVDTRLILQTTSLRDGSVTNLVGRLGYDPAP